MAVLLRVFTITTLFTLHVANSYILLTANIEDVHELAKQVVASPIAGELNKIFRRAANIFKQQVDKGRQKGYEREYYNDKKHREYNFRGDGESTENVDEKKSEHNQNIEDSNEAADVERRNLPDPEIVKLGKNASLYLNSVKKVFESI